MNEEKLTFLWQNYANNPDLGFKDYDEFKSLMADDNSRSVFFEASNADLGFQDYDEFNTILGFSSDGGADMGFTEGSQEPSPQPSQPSEESGITPYDIRTAEVQLEGESSPSTVLMESGGYDGKEYAYPTLFPKDPNKQTNNPNDWIRLKGEEAFREAKKRGEVWEFNTPQEADEYARGSWKKQEKPEEALLENIRKIQQQKNREAAGSQIKTDGGKTEDELEFDKLLIKEFPTATGDVYYGAPTIENVEKGKALDPAFSAYMLSRSRQDNRIPEKLRAGAYTEEEKFAFLNDFYNRRTGELQEKVNQTTAVNTAKVAELDKQIEESKQRLAQTGLFSLDENGNLQSSAANERVDAAIKNMQSAVKEQFMPQFNTLSGEYDQKSSEIKDRIEQLNIQYKESANAAKTQEQLDQINAKYQSDFDALNQELENAYSQYKTAFDNVNSQYEAEASNQYEALRGTLSQEQIDAQSLLDSHNTLIESRNSLVNNVKQTKPFIDLLNVSTKQQSFFNENKPIVERLEERQKEVERLSQGGFTDLVYYEDLGRRALNSLNAFATDLLAAPAGIAVTMEEAVGRGAEYTINDRIVDWAEKTRNPLVMGEREFLNEKGEFSAANLISSATDQLGLLTGLAAGNAYSEARLAQQLSKAPMTTFNKEVTKKIASRVNTVVGASAASWNMNLKEATDMGLSGDELASYVTFMSFMEGTSEMVLPNNKIFSKETKDIMLKTYIKNIGKGRKFAAREALSTLSEVMGKEAFEEYMVMLGKTIETAAISLENEDIDVYIPTLQEVINTGATAMVAAGGPSMVSQIGLRKDLETAAIIKGSQIDFDQLKSDVSQQVSAGVIDLNSANDYLEKVNRQKTINEFVPEDLSLEAKIKLNPIAEQISQLTEQAKDKKGVAKKEIDAKIEQLENDMISIINEDRGISVRIEEPTTVEQYGDKQEVKLKEEEDAIQEREAEEVPVGEVPTPSEEMDKEVREQAAPEKPEASPEERLISAIEAREEAPTLSDSIGKKVFKGDTPVTIRQEGQQIVTDDGTTITELGNIDEVGSATLEEFELKSTPTTGVEVTGPRDVIIDGRPAKIISSRVDKKGRRVVKVKDSETGLIARIKGPRAEEIAKDLALQAQESPESLRLIEEGKPVTEPKPIKEKEDLDALTLQEVERQAKALEEETKEYENMLLEEAETGMAVGDIEIVEVDGKPYLVKKKRGGEFSITNDKGIGVRGQERANVEAAFDNQQRRAQEQRLEEAAEEAERFRQEQGDKILDILDKAIAATDTRGKAYDATLGLPLFVFNSSLKIVRAAYKAGKTIAEAIQEALDFLNSKGYDVNVNAFKSRIAEEIGKTKEAPAEVPVDEKVREQATPEEEIDETLSKASGTTQVATTTGSYKKVAKKIKGQGNVLDYGAGLGLGTDAMSDELGRTVDSYEINTERWKGKNKPTYTKSEDINKKYDSIVSLNVVNVVPKDVRDFIVKDIFKLLNDGGTAYISSRAFKGDINNAKNFREGPESKSIIVERKKDGKTIDVFQKGFDGNELVEYVQELLGDAAIVEADNSFGARGVKITKVGEAQEQATPEQKVAAAKQNLQDTWDKWKESQRNLGVAFDPESKAKEDVELFNAIVDYVKAAGLKTARDVYDLVQKLTDFSVAIGKKYADKVLGASYNIPEVRDEQGRLLAPNGKPSNLNEQQWKEVRTPEFKSWFGDWENNPQNASKVVDENGEPLVVYHGSPAIDITEFDRSKSKRASSGLKEFGTYFATNKALSELYAQAPISEDYKAELRQKIATLEQAQQAVRSNAEFDRISEELDKLYRVRDGYGGRVYPVYLNLRDMVEFDAKEDANIEAWSRHLKVDLGYKTAVGRDAMEAYAGLNAKTGDKTKVDGIKANNVIDMSVGTEDKTSPAYQEAKELYLGDVFLVFDGQPQNIKMADGSGNTSKVIEAKQNLQDAWSKWKEQQRTTGIVFDPRSSAEQDVALTRAVLDYLKAIGAKTIEDVKAAVKNLAGFSIKDEDARYLLNKAEQKVADPKKPQTNNIIDDAFEFADKSNFKNKLEFKEALQERFEKDLPRLREEYGIKDGTTLDENLKRYLIDAYLYETLVAIGSYPDAIGWYDYKTRAAMEIMSLIHPEIKTDENAKAIFTMAVAITSNGNKVFDNFKEADRQYTYFKENGKFDSKKSIGTQSAGIKATFKFLNNIIEGVPIDAFVNFLTAEVRAGDLFVRDGAKKKNIVSGYAADTTVYGASVFGPKIGNGFFMNLYGVFDQLTMDRWFMRQYGRLTGTLLESGEKYEAKIKNSRVRLEDAVKNLSDTEKKILRELVPQAKGRITKANIDSLADGIMKSSMDVDARKKLSSTLKLNEVRKAGNSLSKSLSGEIEAPTASKRAFIIDIFDEVQKRLKEEYGIDMTIADLQAVNWYPEKSLYKAFKADQSSESAATETSDNEQPDYESAAKKLAVETYNISSEKIQDATRGIRERGESIAESNRARIEELGTEDQRNNQRAIREAVLKIKGGFELSPTEKFMDSYKTWTIKTKCQ